VDAHVGTEVLCPGEGFGARGVRARENFHLVLFVVGGDGGG
jgi:hypothetical protein